MLGIISVSVVDTHTAPMASQNKKPYEKPFDSTLYPYLDEAPMATFPKVPDKPRKATGGSGFVVAGYSSSSVNPKWNNGQPIDGGCRITQFFGKYHSGLDCGVPIGTPIHAMNDGTVLYAGWSTGYGYNVVIEHLGGFQTRYAHASKLLVKKGQQVKTGDIIMLSGNSGRSSGPHLHSEVIYLGSFLNPARYIKI